MCFLLILFKTLLIFIFAQKHSENWMLSLVLYVWWPGSSETERLCSGDIFPVSAEHSQSTEQYNLFVFPASCMKEDTCQQFPMLTD